MREQASRPRRFSKAVLSAYRICAGVGLYARLQGLEKVIRRCNDGGLVQMTKPVNLTKKLSSSSPGLAMQVMACNLAHDVSCANFTNFCEGRRTFCSTCLHFGTSPHASGRSGQEDGQPARIIPHIL